jgi:putative PEP-CTERM system histidine kinase
MQGLPAAVWSYGIGAVAYSALLLQLLLSRRASPKGALLAAAIALSAGWEVLGAIYAHFPGGLGWHAYRIADGLRMSAWLAFCASLLLPATAPRRMPWWVWLMGAVGMAGVGVGFIRDAGPAEGLFIQPKELLAASLLLAMTGIVLVEQVFRRADEHGRWALKPICIGLVAIFGFDIFLFSDAWLFSHTDRHIWSARGVAHALIVPLILMSAARSRDWKFDVAISRGVVFRSTALLAAGAYLLTVSAAGYYVRYFGGNWGQTLQVALLFAAVVGFGLMFTSGTVRSRLRVFVSKNFFSYRYDYRDEWLRLTKALSAVSGLDALYEASCRALADLVESPSAALFLRLGDGYTLARNWNLADFTETEPADGPLATFLRSRGWVIDLGEARRTPAKYGSLAVPAWLTGNPEAWLIIPLPAGDELLGFMVIGKSRADVDLNWEVLDLLKTAARQVANVIAQWRMADELLEARKFDAFNRMSAFVVHDLKNVVAQLSLMVKNAARHGDKPEFRKDMVETVQHAVARMNGLMLQLRSGTQPIENAGRIELSAIIERVLRDKAVHPCRLTPSIPGKVFASGHEDRVERVLGHLVQNAIEASEPGSEVRVALGTRDGRAMIEVSDDGVGMSDQFIRERLFRPFHSTKTSGMGIGAYESRQYLREIGGDLLVESEPGRGTRMRMLLPMMADPGSVAPELQEPTRSAA